MQAKKKQRGYCSTLDCSCGNYFRDVGLSRRGSTAFGVHSYAVKRSHVKTLLKQFAPHYGSDVQYFAEIFELSVVWTCGDYASATIRINVRRRPPGTRGAKSILVKDVETKFDVDDGSIEELQSVIQLVSPFHLQVDESRARIEADVAPRAPVPYWQEVVAGLGLDHHTDDQIGNLFGGSAVRMPQRITGPLSPGCLGMTRGPMESPYLGLDLRQHLLLLLNTTLLEFRGDCVVVSVDCDRVAVIKRVFAPFTHASSTTETRTPESDDGEKGPVVERVAPISESARQALRDRRRLARKRKAAKPAGVPASLPVGSANAAHDVDMVQAVVEIVIARGSQGIERLLDLAYDLLVEFDTID
jgi:hypothetical protein